ncbi:zinc-binding dehydrogenase [Kutzneria sp. CA-103260]|uniref:zinc-binding dehydrogenase n=1 Tax=Kutzneria sp. CA-103260 TaxID=2802641 RepID=UPI002741EB2C|nr:zinc-binding dehydrogenase [Kutzneria sp. CA-103260]
MRIARFGPPEVLEPVVVDDPVPGPGQVVIDVEYAGITFVETQIRAGRPPVAAMLPTVLGNGVAGVVAETGPDVDRGLVGKRVTASLNGRGGYAERAVAEAQRLIEVPDGLGLDQAAALIADGRTALAVLGAVGDLAGATVLVEAAAGGVGGLLVQLVSAAGGRVVAAASGAAKLAVAKELGAEVTVDYSEQSWTEGIDRVDVVLDGVGGTIGEQALSLVRPGGVFCPYGAAAGAGVFGSAADAGRPDVRTATTGMLDVARQVALAGEAIALAASGRLRATVGQVFALSDAADAHSAIENRATIGKTLLSV